MSDYPTTTPTPITLPMATAMDYLSTPTILPAIIGPVTMTPPSMIRSMASTVMGFESPSDTAQTVSREDLTNQLIVASDEIEQCATNWGYNDEYVVFKNEMQNMLNSVKYNAIDRNANKFTMSAVNFGKSQIMNKFCSADSTIKYLNNLIDMPETVRSLKSDVGNLVDMPDTVRSLKSQIDNISNGMVIAGKSNRMIFSFASNEEILGIVIITLLIVLIFMNRSK